MSSCRPILISFLSLLLKAWELPHQDEKITEEQVIDIIDQVERNINENTVQIVFE